MNPILEAAHQAWNDAAQFRQRRSRYKRFTYGDQWSDTILESGRLMTMADAARSHGRRPMTNNLLRRLVKSVIGRYRYMRQSQDPLTGTAAQAYERNLLDELDCRALEEFLISGCTVQRIERGRRPGRGNQLWVDLVSPDDFFVNRLTDPRGWDVELVGMVHDWSLAETVLRLAGPDRRLAARIRHIYSDIASSGRMSSLMASDVLAVPAGSRSFLEPRPGRCRVIEVWTLETGEQLRCHDTASGTMYTTPVREADAIDALNAGRRGRGEPGIDTRWEGTAVWRCRWLAPDGTLLHSYVSTAPDGSHPFKFRFYPMIDGEVHSLVEDVIDQQIYINELISLIDHVVSCSAKGVLLFPVEEKLNGMDWETVARIWSSPDGIIPVRGIPGRQPTQVMTQNAPVAARELLATQMQMFEDVSGVANALMGKSQQGNIGAEHYESQVRNAIIAIADILDTFGNFIAERNRLLSQ